MKPGVDPLLRLLQALCFGRIRLEYCRLHATDSIRADLEEFQAHQRVIRQEREVAGLFAELTARQRSELKIGRALYLRMLLDSAPIRLQGWSDRDALDAMPKSHLFEWIAHDYEQQELAELESAMNPQEAARFASAATGSLTNGDNGCY
ncbi:MAG TPA: hypothetical protein VGI11_18350 [Variovorax sp.]|jgi:hypothetical protein